MRGDFFTRLAALPGLGDDLPRALYLLRPLPPEGVRAAITGPAAQKGVGFEPPSLVDTLAEAATTAGGLPVLQFALAELWEARGESSRITAAALDGIGGVDGALARHADEVLFGLPAEARAAARRVLLRLVTGEGTRARRTATELGADEGPVRAAIEALVRGRLVVGGESEGETGYEIAHEALLERWATLRAWVEETHEQKLLVEEIERTAELWSRRGRREEETWAGDALGQAVHRVAKGHVELPATARAFLDAGVRRQHAEQRTKRRLLGGAAGVLALVAAASTAAAVAFSEKEKLAIRQQEQIRLAAADMGALDLVLEPFDWDGSQQRATPAPVPASLDWRLHSISPDDAHAPGRPYGTDDVRRSSRRIDGPSQWERVEARSGPAFLEVMGRGDGCASSWIYLQRLPGYTDRVSHTNAELHIPVPTCQASREEMIEIPAGEFYRNIENPGEGSSTIDELVDMPAFAIDRTEVPRGAFAMYAKLEGLTGDAAARTSYLNMDRPGGERLPIVGVNSYTAANYCRFVGKELPTVEQWQKAVRGGLSLDGAPNPAPKRITPWSKSPSKPPTNIQGADDGFPNLAPVGSFPEDTSPYGVVDLGGNVSEWSRATVESSQMKGLRFILGASWDMPPEHAAWRNVRPDRYLDFTIGIRCVR